MVSNNQYYKAIAELLNDTEYTGEHNDGYYLKRIVEHYGVSYSKVKCKGKYLKDWARAILGTVTGSHANNYYLKNIAEALTSVEYSWRSENRYLKIILDNIADISKVTTKLLWGTPPTNLVYGDEFNATVTLTEDSSNNPIPDATIELICGSTTIGTGTTDSNGVATVTAIPMSAGSHRFYFKYNGNVNYSGSFSSEETISVSKETCILNVTSPSDYSSIYTDSSVSVTGTLTENDTGYPPMKNTEINYSIVTDGSTIKTGRFDTDNNGAFNTVITGFTTGTTTNLILSYNGDSNYNSVSKTIPLTVSAPSLVVSSNKPILSYADSESATLTATLNSGDNIGKTITFYNVTNDIQLGTGVTDSNGVAQCNMPYLSQGIGDVEFEASYGSLVSETYAIEDCTYYNSGTITSSQTLNIPNIPVNFKASYKMKRTSNSNALSWLNIGTDANNCFFFGQVGQDVIGIFKRVSGTNASLQTSSYGTIQINTEYLLEFNYNNGTLTLDGCGTTLTGSYTLTNRNHVSTNIGANNYMKELKIKPL